MKVPAEKSNPAKDTLPMVVLFGRPNVGKSTLFNRLTEKNQALVSNEPGTTRDVNEAVFEWQGRFFRLVDTGGIMNTGLLDLSKRKSKKIANKTITAVSDIDVLVQRKASRYIEQADLIIFMLDARDGLMPQDREMARMIQKKHALTQKVITVVNKADNLRLRSQSAEFNKLGLGEPLMVSSTIGSGTGDLLDAICQKLPAEAKPVRPTAEERPLINVSIIGKPNVGKSSLVNAILGEDKIIVSPLPHTTREPNDTLIEYGEYDINLIDTAGVSKTGQKSARRKSRKFTLEKLSIEKSLKSLNKSEIGLLVIDIKEGLTHQETKLIEEITKTNTSLVLVANKWDLVEEKDTKAYTGNIYSVLPFATWAPIIFVSALTGSKVHKILDIITEIHRARQVDLSEKALDKFLVAAIKNHSPKASRGTVRPYIYKLKQENVNPPQFSITIGRSDSLEENYVRYLSNRLREKFKITGTPVSIYVKKKAKVHGGHGGADNADKAKE